MVKTPRVIREIPSDIILSLTHKLLYAGAVRDRSESVHCTFELIEVKYVLYFITLFYLLDLLELTIKYRMKIVCMKILSHIQSHAQL